MMILTVEINLAKNVFSFSLAPDHAFNTGIYDGLA